MLGSCSETPPGPQILVEIVRPDGTTALDGVDHAVVTVQQVGEPASVTEQVVTNGLDIALEVADPFAQLDVTIELSGPSIERIGAPPRFVIAEAGSAIRVLADSPSHCEIVSGLTLESSGGVGLSLHWTYALVIGPSDNAGFIDLLDFSYTSFARLGQELGRTVATSLGGSRALVISENVAPFIYDLSSNRTPVIAVDLHVGAGLTSTFVELGTDGALVIGGGSNSEPVAAATWLDREGQPQSATLATRRSRAAAVRWGEGILIVGGQQIGELFAELIPLGASSSEPIDVGINEVRVGGALFVDSEGTRALLVGGTDALGAVRAETFVIEGRGASPGPTWGSPRIEPTALPFPGGGGLLLGSTTAVDRVVFGDSVHLEPTGSLRTARDFPSAITFGTGISLVAGGTNTADSGRGVEICFPPSLVLPGRM